MPEGWNVLAVDGLEVTYEWEGWQVLATWPQRGRRHEVVVLLQVRWAGAGPRLVCAPTRVNLYSGSAMNSIAILMRKVGAAKEDQVDPLLQDIRMNLMEWYAQSRRTERPDPNKHGDDSGWILYPIWPYPGIVGVTAAPDSFKSFLGEGIALQARTGSEILTRNTRLPKPRRILYLDWESGRGRFAQRLGALCRGAGLEPADYLDYQHLTIPLADAAPTLAEDIIRHEIDAVIIDSMSAGIGGPMKEDEAVSAFYDAVRHLDRPTLLLAHKSAENIRRRQARFFGSIMSEVRLRMAWNAERVENTVVWECFKDNDTGMKGKKLAWDVGFQSVGEKEETRLHAVTIQGTNPKAVVFPSDEPGKRSPRWRRIMDNILAEGPGTPEEIAHRLGDNLTGVRTELSRRAEFRKMPDGIRYELRMADREVPQ